MPASGARTTSSVVRDKLGGRAIDRVSWFRPCLGSLGRVGWGLAVAGGRWVVVVQPRWHAGPDCLDGLV
ncbi:hypothetical protein ABZP36_006211 [Zizania latifolia]